MARDKDTGRFTKAAPDPERASDSAAASFYDGAPSRSVWLSTRGGPTLIDQQKFRNNWLRIPLKGQISACRKVSKFNGMVRPIIKLRAASFGAGFKVKGLRRNAPYYDFQGLMRSAIHESLVSSNVVAMWRKGATNPPITILNTEQCEYTAVGGIEKLTLDIARDPAIASEKNADVIAAYRENLGRNLHDAYISGGKVTIIKGFDEDWDFEVMTDGKWEGCFSIPELVGLLDTIDFLELMGVGDWNLAWFRKDVIRYIKKGWKGTGPQAQANGVDMTDPDKKALGEGFKGLVGNANIPMNHDVDPGYLVMPPEPFDPKQIKNAIDRLMVYGGIESVVLLGSFSQQNGAAPSLMRNHRTEALDVRGRMESFVTTILSAVEFRTLIVKPERLSYGWSVKSLYSIDEIMALVGGTSDGIASPQRRREWLDLDDADESRLMRESHKRKEDYTPPFEGKQGLLGDKPGSSKSAPGEGGRPGASDEV